jgi:hypothetical protein
MSCKTTRQFAEPTLTLLIGVWGSVFFIWGADFGGGLGAFRLETEKLTVVNSIFLY